MADTAATSPVPIEHSPTQLEGDQGQKGPAAGPTPQAQLDGWKQAAQSSNPQTEDATAKGSIDPQQPPPMPPVVITPVQRPGIMGIVDKMADVLAGKTTPQIATDNQGNKYVQERTLSRGEQWVKIAGDLGVGAAEGLKAGRGGNIGGAAAAGAEAGMHLQQQQQQQKKDLTAEARQQNLDNANNQILRMNMYEQGLRARRLEIDGTQHDIKFAQDEEDRYTKAGGQVLAHVQTLGDISKVLEVDPDVVSNMVEKHQIEIVPHYSADGKADGVNVIKMPDGYRKTMLPSGATFVTFDSQTGQYLQHHASEPMTQGEVDDLNHTAAIAGQKFASDKTEQELKKAQATKANTDAAATAAKTPSEIGKNKAEAVKDYAEAEEARVRSNVLSTANDSATIESNAKQLVDADTDPSNLSKRSKTYDATLAAANNYSLAHYGVPFSPAQAISDFKYATNPNTQNTLKFLNSLTGHDNKGGNLATLVQQSNALQRTEFPPLNAVEQWAKLSAGNPQVAAYRATLLEVSDQIAKILQGGGTGNGTSDAKLKQAGEIMDKNFTAGQIVAVANTSLRPLLANRKNEMIGTNRYLQRWYGPQAGQPQQQQQQSQRPERPNNVPAGYLFVKTTPQDAGQWIDPSRLVEAKQVAPNLQVIQ